VGAIESIRDVTDIRRAEEEKAKLQVQLQQSQKMEAIGTLAGGIAHDFNNILAAVMGYAELALDNARAGRPSPGELEQVLEAAERAKSLVQQILTFSRKVEAQSQPMDLNYVVLHVAGMLERTIPKMIEIELILSEDLRALQGDATQLEQVLINLATNAVDAMPDGGQLLIETQDVFLGDEYCRVHMGVEPGQYVWLRVSDTGVGMDQQTINQIYDPFFTTKEVGRGTGLGLASVYGIVKDHGGHISCYSEVGSGTIFNIYLPALETGASDLEKVAQIEKEITGGDETILVVDDEEPILEVARDLLERHGYTVIQASRGEEALEIFRERGGDIRLIILDLGMPGMGGHKTLKALLELDPRVKVVIASGYSVNGRVKDSLAAGAAGYIGKPYRLHDLLHKVREVLDS
jgi:two-component system cell cycle sensor histidine kinase/response regulator CckA